MADGKEELLLLLLLVVVEVVVVLPPIPFPLVVVPLLLLPLLPPLSHTQPPLAFSHWHGEDGTADVPRCAADKRKMAAAHHCTARAQRVARRRKGM